MRFEELLERWEGARLSHGEAVAALGVSERTLRRWRQRYEEEGADDRPGRHLRRGAQGRQTRGGLGPAHLAAPVVRPRQR